MLNRKTKEQMKRFMDVSFDTKLHMNEHYIKGEKAVISIHVNEKEELYSKYDPQKRILNPELIDYIKQIVYYIPYQYSIVLEFCGIAFDEEEKVHLVDVITEQFGLITNDMAVELKYNHFKTITLFLLGAISLLASFMLLEKIEIQFFREILSIIGTFFIWEAIDNVWFERKKIKTSKLNAGQLSTCTVTFLED